MRTYPYDHNHNKEHYDKLGIMHKRQIPPIYTDDLEKEELESMEETDTEKSLKKINVASFRKPNKHFIRDFGEFREEIENKPSAVENMERYRRQYEIEKLRYGEERNKYFY